MPHHIAENANVRVSSRATLGQGLGQPSVRWLLQLLLFYTVAEA